MPQSKELLSEVCKKPLNPEEGKKFCPKCEKELKDYLFDSVEEKTKDRWGNEEK